MEGIQLTTSLFWLRTKCWDWGTLPPTGNSVVLTGRRQDWVFRNKGKGKITVPENCTIFLRDGKQLIVQEVSIGCMSCKGGQARQALQLWVSHVLEKGLSQNPSRQRMPRNGPVRQDGRQQIRLLGFILQPRWRYTSLVDIQYVEGICLDLRWEQTAEFEPFVGSLEWTSGEEVYYYLGLCYPLIWGW